MGDWALVAALGLGYLALLIWLVTPTPPVGFYWDDGWYLLMAEWLSGRGEYRDLAWNMLHLRQYPPGYPAVLALVGAGLEHPDAGFIMNAVAGSMAAFVLMLWMRRSEGFSLISTVVAAAILVLNPVALTWLPTLFSEHWFMLLTVVALWVAAIARTPGAWVLLGFLVGLSVITRSAGIALLIAVVISAAISNWRRLPWLVLGLLPALAAGYWLTLELPSVPRYRASLADLWTNVTDPAYLSAQSVGMARGWSEMWGSVIGGWIALLAVLPGLWIRLRRHRADAWLVPVTLLMLLIWPFPDHMPRLVWPLMPALLVCAAESARSFSRPPLRLIALWAMPVVFALGVYNGAIRTVLRAIEPPEPPLRSLSRLHEWTRAQEPELARDALEFRHGLMLDMQRIEANTPAGACVYAEYPALVAVQAKRASPASPWRRLSELANHPLHCEFYYLVPLALPQTTLEDIERTGRRHEVLFRSTNPLDPAGPDSPGILYRLKPE